MVVAVTAVAVVVEAAVVVETEAITVAILFILGRVAVVVIL
jgi:hypothetical protein